MSGALPSVPQSNARPKPGSGSFALSRFWWLVLFFWLVVSLASGLELSLLHAATRKVVVLDTVLRLLSWIFMTLLVVWVSAAYTLDRTSWRRTGWIYLAACVLSLGVVALLSFLGPPPLLAAPNIRVHSLGGLILRRLTYQLPTFWGLVAVAHAVRFYERENARQLSEEQLQKRLAQTRLQALQLQLNPHFLFNALNSIAALVHQDPATAERMIEALSRLLRLALTNTERLHVSLREELHFLEQYLMIQRIRFGDRLRVDMNVDDALLATEVPALLLQPLVENAFKHGLEKTRDAVELRISIQPHPEQNALCLTVINTGPVLQLESDQLAPRTGWTNIRARLQEFYGAAARLEWQAPPAGGFETRVVIPRRAHWNEESSSLARETAILSMK